MLALVREWYLPDGDDAVLDAALSRLEALPIWPVGGFDGTRAGLAGLKRLTSGLIGRFCETTQQATHAAFGPGPLVRHDADLVVPDSTRDEIAVLKGVAAHYVMRAPTTGSSRWSASASCWPSWAPACCGTPPNR